MKWLSKYFLFALLLFFSLGQPAYSQPKSNDPPTLPGFGEDGDQGVPIGGGLAILLTLAAAYGAGKAYKARKKLNE